MSSVMWDRPELAECYDRVSDVQFESGRMLIDRMNVREGDSVLDVGCGTGRLALYLAKIVGQVGSVTGIDPSPHRIRIAESKVKARAVKNVRFQIGRGEDLHALPGGTFSHVCYSSVFHWIEDKRATLREASRVTKPGGNIGITTIDRDHHYAMKQIMERLVAEKYPELTRGEDEFNKRLVSKPELLELLVTAGFHDVQIDTLIQKHYYSSAWELFEFIEASSFGNFMREVPEHLRSGIIEDMGGELEKRRTEKGIELESEMLIAVAARR